MNEWTDFMKGKMGRYMKRFGSHKKAIRALSKEYKRFKNKKNKRSKRTSKK